MPTQYEVEAVLEDVCKAVLKPHGVEDFDDLDDDETLFTIAIACFSAARAAVVAAKGSDDEARAWFEHLIAECWKAQP